MNKKQSLASIESIKTLYYIIDESNFSSQSNKKWQCISINLKWLNIKIKNKRLIHLNCHVHRGIQTLRSLSSVLFYQMTWSEFFQKVSIKQRGPFQKKLIARFHFRAATANFWSLLYELAWIFGKSLLNDQYYHFFKF